MNDVNIYVKNDFIKKVYLNLKKEFVCLVSKNNWIWIDYFADENGYEYFHNTYLNDIENITNTLSLQNTDEEDDINDISTYIKDIWITCEFTNALSQESQFF